ncbi:MAG TPA: hypothetical protein DCG79_05710, partial [Clostridiales bacterium]|nr:hypothetical protein [Clostridiales bacterium]
SDAFIIGSGIFLIQAAENNSGKTAGISFLLFGLLLLLIVPHAGVYINGNCV